MIEKKTTKGIIQEHKQRKDFDRKGVTEIAKVFNRVEWVRVEDVKNIKESLKNALKGECSAEDVERNVFIFEENKLDSIIDSVFDDYELSSSSEVKK